MVGRNKGVLVTQCGCRKKRVRIGRTTSKTTPTSGQRYDPGSGNGFECVANLLLQLKAKYFQVVKMQGGNNHNVRLTWTKHENQACVAKQWEDG